MTVNMSRFFCTSHSDGEGERVPLVLLVDCSKRDKPWGDFFSSFFFFFFLSMDAVCPFLMCSYKPRAKMKKAK